MVWNLDKSVGSVVQALSENKMLENTILVFVSDNGAQTVGFLPNDGSNYPMKGVRFYYNSGKYFKYELISNKLYGCRNIQIETPPICYCPS